MDAGRVNGETGHLRLGGRRGKGAHSRGGVGGGRHECGLPWQDRARWKHPEGRVHRGRLRRGGAVCWTRGSGFVPPRWTESTAGRGISAPLSAVHRIVTLTVSESGQPLQLVWPFFPTWSSVRWVSCRLRTAAISVVRTVSSRRFAAAMVVGLAVSELFVSADLAP